MAQAIIRDVLIIFIVAIPVVIVAHKLKFPAIVGFLITGFLIGPHALRFIQDNSEIRFLAEVGVALLLFSIGLEFSFERLKGWGRSVAGMGIVQVMLTTVLGFLVGNTIGLGNAESAFLGCAISLSSTAVVLAVLSHKRWFDAPAGRIATGVLILQDLAVIPMMVILKLLYFPHRGINGNELWLIAALKIVTLIVIIICLAKWVLQPLLHFISKPRSKELFVVVVIGLAIGSAYCTELLGLSFALGAFLAGLLVSTTEYRFHALSEIAPFRHCFNGIFFVAVGMMVDMGFILNHWQWIVGLVLCVIVIKMIVMMAVIVLFGYPVSVAAITALMLTQVGEFSFMLVLFGWRSGAISFDFYQIVVDMAAITLILAPVFVALAPRLGEKLSFITWRFKKLKGKWEEMTIDTGNVLNNHAIICGFGPLGMTVGDILKRHGIDYVVIELNPETTQKIKKQGINAYVGDGASSALLHHIKVDKAKLLAIAVPDQLNALAIVAQARKLNEKIFIVARSRYRNQVQSLYDAGADVVICEELEGGIEMGRYILSELKVDEAEIERTFKEIRAFGSADFF